VIPERCERFRESISLGLDGLLSTFEAALLDRHLSRCPSCSAFAAAVSVQTELLRDAAFEQPARRVAVRPAARVARRRASGLVAAVAVAGLAALLGLTPTAGQNGGQRPAIAAAGQPLLAVFPADPSANATFEVPRLRVVSPAFADGAVRGYYGLPA